MPITDVNAIASPSRTDWFEGEIPGGDTPLDELFPTTDLTVNQQTTAPSDAQPAPVAPQVPQTPTTEAFEFKTATGTVYKSREEAIRGTEEKDRLLEQLRQRYIMERGIDPVTNRPVNLQDKGSQGPVNYMQDNKRYMRDLKEAVDKGDESAYFQAQAKLVFDLLSPLAGTINNAAKEQAVQTVSKQVNDFSTFRQSTDYDAVLADNPALKNAIETSENDFRGHAQLPELYKLAYYASQGRKVPDLIKQATQAAAQAAPVQPQQVRQTFGQSTVAPQAPQTRPAAFDVSTPQGRKDIIADFERQGGMNVKF